MAKMQELAVVMVLGLIYWFKDKNRARPSGEYGSEKESEKVLDSLTEHGWFRTGDGIIEVVKMTKDEQERAIKLLEARWAELKAEAEQTNNTLSLKSWEAVHAVNGKLLKPEYRGISGNRRGSLVHRANARRMDPKREGGPLPAITEVGVIIKEFSNPTEEMDSQMMENSKKAEGFLPPSDKDLLLWSVERVQLGGTQSDLRRVLTDTTGQKFYWIIELDRRFKKAGFIERLLKPVDDNAHIRLSGVKGNELPNLGLRSDPKKLEAHNQKVKNSGKLQNLLEPLTLEGFQDYLNSIGKKPVGNEPKIMKKESIQGLADNNKCDTVKAVAKSIIDNDIDALKKFNDNADAYNALGTLVDDGDGPSAAQLLQLLVACKGDTRTAMFKKFIGA